MRAAIRYTNTFSTSRFGGNPTPVVVLPSWPSDATLLALARETGLGYTAFVVSGDVDALRWFHPVGESMLCGHVAGIAPDFPALARAEPGEVVVTAAAPGPDFDFVCRCFEPALGVDEDPVTGSAQCTLGPYWAERVGRTRLRSRQLSARGGEITCVVGAERVAISGAVSTYLEGVIEVGED